eukprot:scaffold32798_cov78-Skeletonema_marinoi.AAC.1
MTSFFSDLLAQLSLALARWVQRMWPANFHSLLWKIKIREIQTERGRRLSSSPTVNENTYP